jgi:hypothetical protein
MIEAPRSTLLGYSNLRFVWSLVIGAWSLLFAWSFLLAGCGSGGPDISYVSGRVTMDGKPLPNASVVFIPENGRPAGANTDEDGNYVLNFAQGRRGAIPGKNTIRITTLRDPYEGDDGKMVPGSPETIPSKYNASTTLEFTVEPRKRNVANFDLTSK